MATQVKQLKEETQRKILERTTTSKKQRENSSIWRNDVEDDAIKSRNVNEDMSQEIYGNSGQRDDDSRRNPDTVTSSHKTVNF